MIRFTRICSEASRWGALCVLGQRQQGHGQQTDGSNSAIQPKLPARTFVFPDTAIPVSRKASEHKKQGGRNRRKRNIWQNVFPKD